MPTVGPPQAGQVILAVICVTAGALASVAALIHGWRSRNWIAYIFALGCAAFAAGLVGQRSFPSADAVRRLGAAAARTARPGPFDAGITIPVVGLQLTPVALAGILIAALALSLLLVFESGSPGRPPRPALPPLADEDAA